MLSVDKYEETALYYLREYNSEIRDFDSVRSLLIASGANEESICVMF